MAKKTGSHDERASAPSPGRRRGDGRVLRPSPLCGRLACVRASRADTPAYDFTAALWEWEGKAAWFFVTVPVEISDEIDARTHGLTNGFGSVRVHVRIGDSDWMTSLFPDSKQQAYVLPIKKAVRVAEGIVPGDDVRVHIEIA